MTTASSALTPATCVKGATLPAPASAGGVACAAGVATGSAAMDSSTAAERWYLMRAPSVRSESNRPTPESGRQPRAVAPHYRVVVSPNGGTMSATRIDGEAGEVRSRLIRAAAIGTIAGLGLAGSASAQNRP